MKYNIRFWVKEKYLPTRRHKKIRERYVENTANINIQEVTEEQFPIAFIVHDYKNVYDGAKSYDDFNGNGDYKMFAEEIRTYNNKFYKPVRVMYGTAMSTIFESLDYIKNQIEECAPYWTDNGDFTTKSIIVNSNIKECIKDICNKAEPMYEILTFGLGHNYGGTAFSITYHYNPNISCDNYFSALERKNAINYGKNIAIKMGDTNSVDEIGKYDIIEVLMPEMVKRNPHKDHGKGDSFISSIEDIIEGADNSTEAGLLVLTSALLNL